MDKRYKDQTMHMLDTFNRTAKLKFTKKQPSLPIPPLIKGENGTTWDAHHLTSFLTRSFYSNQQKTHHYSQPKSQLSSIKPSLKTQDHFFRTTKDNRNASKIGYTAINPLVSNIPTYKTNQQILQNYLHKQPIQSVHTSNYQNGNFKFIANSHKFNKTDPLTFSHIPTAEDRSPSKIQRVKRIIQKRHPHGIIGIDHPQNPESKNYKTFNQNMIIRQEPNSHQNYLLDAKWNSKRRQSSIIQPNYGFTMNINTQRKFSNTNVHGYDIINNRQNN